MSPHCFHETHETPEWLHGFWNITSSYIQWWVVNWWENNSWLKEAIRIESLCQPWSVLLTWHYIVSCNVSYTCTRNLSNYRAVSDVYLSIPVTAAALSWHFSRRFFFVVTPPLMCVLTSSFSDGGRKHFSPPEFRTLQLPPPSFISASGASHLFWLYQQQGLSGELKSV